MTVKPQLRTECAPGTARLWQRSGLFALLALLAGLATTLWSLAAGKTLLYGDATAHLAIARRIVDSATPGLSQLGTVWLPLPHLLMAPLVIFMPLWRNGLAGAVPSLLALVLATWLLHRAVKRAWGPGAAAWAAAFFCLNPSLLYLSAVPMTESIYLACFLGLVDQCAAFWVDGLPRRIWWAAAWALAAALCRYDGWFVLPFALAVLIVRAPRRWWNTAWRFCLLAGAGPVFWFAYNAFYFGDPLYFARGPYSAKAIAGPSGYPGDHSLAVAALYYLKTVVLTCGVPLAILALLGLAILHRRWLRQPVAWLLLLPLPWYLWAMWSGNVPIFLPQYWPHGYYNLRYGVQLLPAVALFSALVVATLARAARRATLARGRLALGLCVGLAILCGGAYAAMLRTPGPPAYAEAVHNAPARLAMEHALAAALQPRRPGERVLMYYGTYPGALADDRIPLHAVIQESNFHLWQRALAHPHAFVRWVVVEQSSPTAALVNRADLRQYFNEVARLRVPGQHGIEVYSRK